MAIESPAWADQASSYSAEQTRRAVFFGLTSTGGVKGSGDLAVTAPASGMSVNVATGEVLIPGSSSTAQGLYYGLVTSQTNLTIAAANPTNPRIDMVCATVDDAAYTGAANDWKLQVVTGTPTAGATLVNLSGAPALPTSSLILAYVLVPANATNIITADIGDKRIRATSALTSPVTLAAVEAVFTAAGQLLVGTGSGTGQLLTPGASGTVLTSTGTAAVPSWQAAAGIHGEMDMGFLWFGSYSMTTSFVEPTPDNRVLVNTAASGVSVYLEAYMDGSLGGSPTPTAQLFDVTSSAAVAGSTITGNLTKSVFRSSAITLTSGHVYSVQFKNAAAGGTCNALSARIVGVF